MLTLVNYQDNREDRARVAAYPLEDPTFTATPQQALAIARDDDRRLPLMVLNATEMVGFLVLITGADVQEVGANPATAVLIRSLSIAETQRGRGFAATALTLLPAFVRQRYPAATELTLAVDHGNLPAQKLYAKVGYVDTGRRGYGTYGEQIILTQAL